MIYHHSALPDVIHCPALACAAVRVSIGPDHSFDDETVKLMRSAGWQVVDGAWTCPNHLPKDRKHLPGAMSRHPNPHCAECGDTRGGPYGHEAHECTWTGVEVPR